MREALFGTPLSSRGQFRTPSSSFRPKSETLTLPVEAACEGDLNADNKGPVPHEDYSEDSLASRGSSGFGSLPRKTRSSLVTGGECVA